MPLIPGTRLGSYEILSMIGRGGMGEVYSARDTELNRLVAVKVLSKTVGPDPVRLVRFEREARLASSLNHPNIITIHTIGRSDSVSYIAMELVDGQTLDSLMTLGGLPLDRVADVGAQIASGLAKAHEAGIVHRDLKPQNVMVTKDGLVKVLDFGLSTLAPMTIPADADTAPQATPLTAAGVILGTVDYMSPEQASARPLDFRSDQFSVGSMLYELVTGRRPFSEPTAAQTLSAIIDSTPTPMAALNPRVSKRLQAIVERCMAKSPSARYGSTQDLAQDLQAAREPSDTRVSPAWVSGWAAGRTPTPTRSRWLVFWLVAAGVAVAVGTATPAVRQRLSGWRVSRTVAAPQQLAVLPFTNVGNDPANQPFSDGLVEVLTSQLTQIAQFSGALDVVPASDVRSEHITSARDARRTFGVSRVITGSIQRSNTLDRITVNLVDAETLRQLNARSIDVPLQDAAVMQDGVVREVAAMLGASMQPEARRAMSVGSTTQPIAYARYLQARGYLQRYEKLENVDLAIASFQRALDVDGAYALAHAGLGEAYWRKYQLTKNVQWADAARSSCASALRLADSLAPVYVTLGLIDTGTGRYDDAVVQLNHAIRLDPVNGDAYRELAAAYQALGQTAAAEASYKTAIQVHPAYWANYNALGAFYYRIGRYADAEAQFKRVLELTTDNARAYSNLGGIYYVTKRYAEAASMFEKSVAIQPNDNERAYSNLGTLYFMEARYPDSARMFERAVQINDRSSLLWHNLATAYYWAPGARDRARSAYERTLALAEQEVQVNPRNASSLMRIAECASMLGDKVRARALVNEALALAPQDVEILFSAGEVYEQLRDRDQALMWIGKALDQGYSRDVVEKSPGLVALRGDPRFKIKMK